MASKPAMDGKPEEQARASSQSVKPEEQAKASSQDDKQDQQVTPEQQQEHQTRASANKNNHPIKTTDQPASSA